MDSPEPRPVVRALVVVDVQNDFCEGGSLGVEGGVSVAERVARLVGRRASGAAEALGDAAYDLVVATRDHHIDPGDHFSDQPDFAHSWPRHCVVGTTGEAFHPALAEVATALDGVFVKGEYTAAYSGFEGDEVESGRPLATWLRDRGVEAVDVCGIATDHCVRATALDAAGEGFAVRVLEDLVAGVAPGTTQAAWQEMAEAGVERA